MRHPKPASATIHTEFPSFTSASSILSAGSHAAGSSYSYSKLLRCSADYCAALPGSIGLAIVGLVPFTP